MDTGMLRQRVTIQSSTDTADSQGGFTTAWSTIDTVWACIEPIGAREQFYRQGLQPNITHRVTIRYRSDVDSTQRISYKSRTLYIRALRNLEERDRWLELICEEAA